MHCSYALRVVYVIIWLLTEVATAESAQAASQRASKQMMIWISGKLDKGALPVYLQRVPEHQATQRWKSSKLPGNATKVRRLIVLQRFLCWLAHFGRLFSPPVPCILCLSHQFSRRKTSQTQPAFACSHDGRQVFFTAQRLLWPSWKEQEAC